jgi:hypothetical protein
MGFSKAEGRALVAESSSIRKSATGCGCSVLSTRKPARRRDAWEAAGVSSAKEQRQRVA